MSSKPFHLFTSPKLPSDSYFTGSRSTWSEYRSENGSSDSFMRDILEELMLSQHPYAPVMSKVKIDYSNVQKQSFEIAAIASSHSNRDALNKWFRDHQAFLVIYIQTRFDETTNGFVTEHYLQPYSWRDFTVPDNYDKFIFQYFVDIQTGYYQHNGSLTSFETMMTEIFGASGYGQMNTRGVQLACGAIVRGPSVTDDQWAEVSNCHERGRLTNQFYDKSADRINVLDKLSYNSSVEHVKTIVCRKQKPAAVVTDPVTNAQVPQLIELLDQEYDVRILRVTPYYYAVEVHAHTTAVASTAVTGRTISASTAAGNTFAGVVVLEHAEDKTQFTNCADDPHDKLNTHYRGLHHFITHVLNINGHFYRHNNGLNFYGVGATTGGEFAKQVLSELGLTSTKITSAANTLVPGLAVGDNLRGVATGKLKDVSYSVRFVEVGNSGLYKIFVVRSADFSDYQQVKANPVLLKDTGNENRGNVRHGRKHLSVDKLQELLQSVTLGNGTNHGNAGKWNPSKHTGGAGIDKDKKDGKWTHDSSKLEKKDAGSPRATAAAGKHYNANVVNNDKPHVFRSVVSPTAGVTGASAAGASPTSPLSPADTAAKWGRGSEVIKAAAAPAVAAPTTKTWNQAPAITKTVGTSAGAGTNTAAGSQFKTRACSFFMNTTNGCNNGLKCTYSHDTALIAAVPECKSGINCQSRGKCPFRHVKKF